MKKRILGLNAAILAAGAVLTATLCRKYRLAKEITEEDGAVVRKNDGTKAPKTVRSDEIEAFECRFSLLAVLEDDLREDTGLKNAVYLLKAVRNDNRVQGIFRYDDRFGNGEEYPFSASPSFMEELHKLVKKHDLAQYNGIEYEVTGLPDFYGASLNIRYGSGETIAADDNQDNFLPLSAMSELAALFALQNK